MLQHPVDLRHKKCKDHLETGLVIVLDTVLSIYRFPAAAEENKDLDRVNNGNTRSSKSNSAALCSSRTSAAGSGL